MLKDIAKSRSDIIGDVPRMTHFAQRWSGHELSLCVDDRMPCVTVLMCSGRVVPGSAWKALASLTLDPGTHHPLFIHSARMLPASCPARHAPSIVSRSVTASDIATLERRRGLLAWAYAKGQAACVCH